MIWLTTDNDKLDNQKLNWNKTMVSILPKYKQHSLLKYKATHPSQKWNMVIKRLQNNKFDVARVEPQDIQMCYSFESFYQY